MNTGQVTGFFHGGITVSDMDRSLAFYRDGLGFEIEVDWILEAPYVKELLGMAFDSIRGVFLKVPGGGLIELLEYRGIERLSAASRPCDPGAGHVCFFVDDAGAVHRRLTELGFRSRSTSVVDITAGPNAGARTVYVADPDGYYVELFQKRAPA